MNRDSAASNRNRWVEQAEARTVQANVRTQQAEARTDQANARTKRAELQTDRAQLRTVAANVRTELAERRERAMRASELSYRRLFEAARDGILILEADTGRISDVNPFMVELLGFSHDEMVGKTVGELSPYKDIVSNQAMLDRLQKDGYVRYEDLPLQTKDGRHIAVEFVSSVYQAGVVKVIQCEIRDMTARNQMESALVRLGAIVDASEDAIIGKGLDGTVTSWNRGAEKIFGYKAAEIIGTSIMRLVPAAKVDEENQLLRQMKRGDSAAHLETIRVAMDGQLIDVLITASPIKDAAGKITGVSKVAHDITQRKRTEQALSASEARFRFLNDLNEATRSLADPEQIMAIMARLLGEHLEASRCAYANVEHDGEQFTIVHDYTDGCASTVGTYQLSLFGARTQAALRGGQTAVIRDVDAELLPDEGADMFSAIGVKAIIVCPMIRSGQLRAMMAVHQTASRDWTVGEITIVEDVAERCWATIERRIAEEKVHRLNEELEQRVFERTAALRASEARYHLLFDSIDEGFCIIQMMDSPDKPIDYRFLEINPSFEKHTGLRNPVGKTMRELTPEHEEHWFEAYDRIARTGEPARFQNQAKGLGRWYDVYACRFGEPANRQVAVVFSDVTEQKSAVANIGQLNAELRQRAAELNSLFESLPGSYLVLTPDLKIVAASDAYLRATLSTREDILGRDVFEVFPDNPGDPAPTAVANMRASMAKVLRDAAPDTMAIQKHDVRRRDGSFEERYWSPINSPMFGADREIKYIVHRVEEVTEFILHKTRQPGGTAEPNTQVQQMEAEIFQSSRNLQATNQQLEDANKELEAFSYSVSHDLRAPLRAINGFAGIVMKEFATQMPTAARPYLERICNGGKQMGLLIDNLLAFSRLSRQPLKRQHVDTAALVKSVIHDLAPLHQGRPIEFQPATLPSCWGDPALLKQVWLNLISNAIKYTRGRDPALIEIGCVRDEGEDVYFVRDNGTGFDMKYAHKLFGVFQRLHLAEEFEGTGVGLAIVQRIVNRHAGRVWAAAEEGLGATFRFTLGAAK
jgi:PAS domain S-box-containing protein